MTEAGGLVSCAQGRTLHTRKWERKEISSLSCAREQRSRRRPTPHLCVAAFEHVDTGSGSATTFLPTSAASLPRPAVAPQSALCLCWGSSGGLCNSRPLRPGQLHTSALAAHAPPCSTRTLRSPRARPSAPLPHVHPPIPHAHGWPGLSSAGEVTCVAEGRAGRAGEGVPAPCRSEPRSGKDSRAQRGSEAVGVRAWPRCRARNLRHGIGRRSLCKVTGAESPRRIPPEPQAAGCFQSPKE